MLGDGRRSHQIQDIFAIESRHLVGSGGMREGRAPCVWHPAPLPEVQTPVADAGLTLWFVESLNRSDDDSQDNRGALR